MNTRLDQHIREILKAKHQRRQWTRLVSVLAAFVVFFTSLEMSSPASTASTDDSPVIEEYYTEEETTETVVTESSVGNTSADATPDIISAEEVSLTEGGTDVQDLHIGWGGEADMQSRDIESGDVLAVTEQHYPESAEGPFETQEEGVLAEQEAIDRQQEVQPEPSGDISSDEITKLVFSDDAAELSGWITGVELERSVPLEMDEVGNVLSWSDWEKAAPVFEPKGVPDEESAESYDVMAGENRGIFEKCPDERLRLGHPGS